MSLSCPPALSLSLMTAKTSSTLHILLCTAEAELPWQNQLNSQEAAGIPAERQQASTVVAVVHCSTFGLSGAGLDLPFPSGFLVQACGAAAPGVEGICCHLKAAVAHDGHLAQPGLLLALGIAQPRSGTVEVLEAVPGSPGTTRCCVVWCSFCAHGVSPDTFPRPESDPTSHSENAQA